MLSQFASSIAIGLVADGGGWFESNTWLYCFLMGRLILLSVALFKYYQPSIFMASQSPTWVQYKHFNIFGSVK